MRNHINILHLFFLFQILLSSALNAKVTVTVDRSGGTTCNIARPPRVLPAQVIYQRASPMPTSVWRNNTSYYAPRTSTTVRTSRKKPVRTFTGLNGKTIDGYLVSINTNDKTAKIKSSKGRSYNIPIHSFSSSDVAYMKTWWTNKNK